MGTTGIFEKRNWKFLQQKSDLHTTRKKTSLKPLKTKNKIRKDYAKVGKSGKTNKSVQDIVHFFEKMGGTSQSQSLTMGNVELLKTKSGSKAGTNLSQKRDVGGGEMVVEKYGNNRNSAKWDGAMKIGVEASLGNQNEVRPGGLDD